VSRRCIEGNDAHRAAAQVRHRLLHDRGEEPVEVE
jgi:hypothetical protein